MNLLAALPRPLKNRLKMAYRSAEAGFVRAFLSYGPAELRAVLSTLGLAGGDSVMLHSSFSTRHGFRGSVDELTATFLDVLGPDGNLLMVSLPYRTSSLQHLRTLRQFDVRRTPSMMGLVSEYFRRRPDVVRSLHPTHPVLACGPRADWMTEAHPRCLYPCGPDTPFDRLLQADGKVVFFNVPFAVLTFFHYLEHRVAPDLPFLLYAATPFDVPVIDRTGERQTVRTFVFSEEALRRRRFPVLEAELRRRGLIARRRLGNGQVEVVGLRDVVRCVDEMREQRRYFYELRHEHGGSSNCAAGAEHTS